MEGLDPNGRPILKAKEAPLQPQKKEERKPEVILAIPKKKVRRVWFNLRRRETLKADLKPEQK